MKAVQDLADGKVLEPRYKMHRMSPASPKEYQGYADFHVSANIVVVFRITDTDVELYRIGSHSDLELTESIQ